MGKFRSENLMTFSESPLASKGNVAMRSGGSAFILKGAALTLWAFSKSRATFGHSFAILLR